MTTVGYVIVDSRNLFVHRHCDTDEPWHFSKLSMNSTYQAFWSSEKLANEYCSSYNKSPGWMIKPLVVES